ncbi:AMP-binding protein [Congregibacter litoralis]|mgnify:CR=1 FL=1|uniref:Acyl-CoA synthetase (AMP-forming)/AMP-acid ligase II n=1 Tax=Congregibacter litoralis KT71 TaxID=314285 RepID=A4ABB7_9GAMM|nr:AMP-binding protein [Congregibacter litoralis]EAQ96671.2 Acyl-CoA synthetase (AMP-forming)/AMP-acid ligase II [Congregibacter litoralis KT71]
MSGNKIDLDQVLESINPDFQSTSQTDLLADQKKWALPVILRRQAAERPDAPAMQFEREPSLSYAELVDKIETIAANLHAQGIRHGDRVALIMENSAEMVFAWFAINFLGAVEVPVNLALRGQFLVHVLENSGAKMVIVDDTLIDPLIDIATEAQSIESVVVNGESLSNIPWRHFSWHDLEEAVTPALLEEIRKIDVVCQDPAAIMYTSGTTGPAKGVLMSHGHMYFFAWLTGDMLRLMARDVFLVVLPLFHGNSQIMQIYATLINGGKFVLYRRFTTNEWIEQAIECGATVSSLLGVMAQFIFDRQPSKRDRQMKITRMVTVPLPAAIAHEFEARFGTICVEAYGMTETSLPILRRLEDPLRPGSCGRLNADWFEVAIVDPETDRILPANEVGEILVRPKYPWTMLMEYFCMPERTVKAWRNLWFHTGDSGRYDEDGYYYFVDRLQDRIRRRGENISSYELEAAATEYDHVLEAAAVAVSAREGEDDIKICLVTKDGDLDRMAFLEHCKKRMPYFAVPRYFCVFDALPKTPNGKVLKRELRGDNGKSFWDREADGIYIRRGA